MLTGEGGIRTRGTVTRTLVFETSSLSRSDTSPLAEFYLKAYRLSKLTVIFPRLFAQLNTNITGNPKKPESHKGYNIEMSVIAHWTFQIL